MNRALSLFALIVAAVLGLGMGEGEAQLIEKDIQL